MATEIRQAAGPAVAAATTASATTAFVVWLVGRLFFRSEPMPPEVFGFLQVAVPAWMGFAAAEVVYWQNKRHNPPPALPPTQRRRRNRA